MPSSTDTNQDVSPLVIAELTGDRRTITLSGRALPYGPYELVGLQRKSLEWYNGNPVGVLQVLGAQEDPTTISGAWKDMFISETVGHPPYATMSTPDGGQQTLFDVETLAKTIDDIRRKGQEIQVSWLHHSRRGIIEKFVQKWLNAHDLQYEIQFTWISQNDEQIIDIGLVSNNPSADLADSPNQAQAQLDQIDDASACFDTAFSSIDQPILNSTDFLLAQIQGQVDELGDAVATSTSILTAPIDSQRRLMGIFVGIKLNADSLVDNYEASIDGARLDLGGTYGQVISDRSTARSQVTSALALRSLAASSEVKISRSIGSSDNVLAIFQARDGDTLRSVSLAFYGTQDNWRDLMLYNNLSDETLVAGQSIVVPRRLPQVAA